jgi:hypothetical protein
MDGSGRITRFDGAVLADALFLIGQAWVKRVAGDTAGAAEDEAATERLLPRDTIAAIRTMIIEGDLPAPGPGPEAMAAWLEQCRLAGAGEWKLMRITQPSGREAQRRQEEDFLARLAEIRAAAEAEHGTAPAQLPAAKPSSLADELRSMGWM